MTTEVKICGIKTAEAIDAATAGGAAYIGLVFCETSPRHLEIGAARTLANLARGKAKIVALLVDPDDRLVRSIVDKVAPDFLQLHGSETPKRVGEIRRFAGRPVVKAIGVGGREDIEAGIKVFAPGVLADIVLFDAKAPKDASRPGGHGRPFDWSVLSDIPETLSWMLSGGLNPDNVAEAIRVTNAPAVDVSSGVETAPGVKDVALIRRFLRTAKTAKQT